MNYLQARMELMAGKARAQHKNMTELRMKRRNLETNTEFILQYKYDT
jgi:hypothetical protein